MKQLDPLLLLTIAVALGLLLILGRFAATGQLSEGLFSVMATILGSLITALSTRKKEKDDKEGGADGG